jgi:peptidylprolyl isomerase domain and WD repeat-containing protein 1
VVNTVTNKVSRVLGKDETLRYLNVSLYQGAPAKKGITTLAMAASANPLLQDKAARDPHVFCTAYKKSRFYVFGRSDREEKGDRDVFNERPTREEQTVMVAPEKKKPTATSLTIHTTMGDIVRLPFPLDLISLTSSTLSYSQMLHPRRSKTLSRTSTMVITTT